MSSGRAFARATDPGTSKSAAYAISGETVTTLEGQVLEAIRESADGLTGLEVTEKLGMDRVTTSPRFAPLERKGLIRKAGRRKSGNGNRSVIVWMATGKGGNDE